MIKDGSNLGFLVQKNRPIPLNVYFNTKSTSHSGPQLDDFSEIRFKQTYSKNKPKTSINI